ncbi:MAG: RND transporter [Gammaproteobacteria bacterium]|nr:RND transporter [Gammaproteobacteria bacterium]MDH5778387.1 RND transporter [Gammaproteobacteria bacterium]
MQFIDRLSLPLLLMVTAFIGLAPFVPEPHVWEKLKMLAAGELAKPLDIFDLLMHGTPWVLTIMKLIRIAQVSTKI